MARGSHPPQSGADVAERIVDIDVSAEMSASFLEYAYSVIYSRALPDARDGLKPVQRRILYSMHDMGLRPERGHVKSSRVVGEVMGKLHPHGDQAIYDALVRMAQSFALRVPLVDGHGNFGSLDNGPAAPRYTEARLAPAATVMTASLDEDVVDFVPNYDNQLTQPEVLPTAFPNLLVNGASGIAVGMATNMPPHNLAEVIAACRMLLRKPDATLSELMKHVPGPDLPGGGRVVGLEGIREAYETGRGSFKTQATVSVENVTARRKGLVVTELPYMVGPERLMEKVKDAVTSGKLQGISNITDLTDRHHGLRVVIELKTGFNPDAVLAQLFRLTPMEDSYSINNVCLVDGQPRTLGLKQLLEVFVDHRLSVVRRRTAFRLRKSEERLHLVQGLLLAIVDIDTVIAIIRRSEDVESARSELMATLRIDHPQAEYILELRLRRLTKFSRLELESERDELTATIAALQEILADDAVLRRVVSDELASVSKAYGSPRRTVLVDSDGQTTQASPVTMELADAPCWVVLSRSGRIGHTLNLDALETQAVGSQRAEHDVLTSAVKARLRGDIAAVTSKGRMVRLPVLETPDLPAQEVLSLASGAEVSAFVELAPDERVLTLCNVEADSPMVALGTRAGVVKRISVDYPNKPEWEAISLKDGDEVVDAALVHSEDDHLVFVTSQAHLLHFPADKVRPQGRAAGGMAGIRLTDGASVIAFGVVPQSVVNEGGIVLTVAGSADEGALLSGAFTAKTTALREYPAKGRATAGVRCHRFLRGESALVTAWVGPGPVLAAGQGHEPLILTALGGRRDGSGTALPQLPQWIGGRLLPQVGAIGALPPADPAD